jgi:predicted lipoprotein with Yx(FWY)xxD motif
MVMNVKYLASASMAIVIAGIVVVVLAVGGGNAKTRPQPAVAAGSAVSVRSTSLGPTLVDARGRTLYLFAGDKRNVSTLSGAGLAVWPRFIGAVVVKAGSGVKAAKLGTVTSPRGTRQVTYNGHPLYYYVGDTTSGSVRGQGLNQFGALWYVLGTAGTAVTGASRAAQPAGTSGYGYCVPAGRSPATAGRRGSVVAVSAGGSTTLA